MSNGARHTWGFFMGVILTAALAALLIFGAYRLQHGYVTQFHKHDKWIGGGLLAGAAVVFALLTASRLSPVASLIGGLVLTAAGVLFFVSQKTTADMVNRFPFKEQRVALASLEAEGFILFAGVALLFASLFPSRWRGREDDLAGYEYGLPKADPIFGEETGGTGGRHAARDDQPAAYGGTQPGAYEQTSYDTPLYEPPQSQHPYTGRPPFNPPEEGGGTREMHRPN